MVILGKGIFCLLLILFSFPAFAWEGYDYESGSYIEIEDGNLVRLGNGIEVYDYDTGEYHNVEVQSVDSDEVEVYDYETGEYRIFGMEN